MKKSLLLLIFLSGCNPLGSNPKIDKSFLPKFLYPKVLSVAPTQGTHLGGTNLTITGTNFTSTTAIKVGAAPCSSLTFVSSTRMICLTPAHDPGIVSVSATGNKKTHKQSSAYTFEASSGSPGHAIVSGGESFATGASLGMSATLGEPTGEQVMTGSTLQLKANIHGIISH